MKTITFGKLGMRYAILMVLGMALMVVAKPNKALALTPCQSACVRSSRACSASCNGNAGCLDECELQTENCIEFCNTGL
jgi:hypothetical protein